MFIDAETIKEKKNLLYFIRYCRYISVFDLLFFFLCTVFLVFAFNFRFFCRFYFRFVSIVVFLKKTKKKRSLTRTFTIYDLLVSYFNVFLFLCLENDERSRDALKIVFLQFRLLKCYSSLSNFFFEIEQKYLCI